MIVPDFTLYHEGAAFKISFDREEDRHIFLNSENVLTGETKNFMIDNYSDGSGNEHLRNQVEGKAASEYVRQIFIEKLGFDPAKEGPRMPFMRGFGSMMYDVKA